VASLEPAGSAEINVHTVLRAYALLRDEGLIDLRRRRGAVVIGGAQPLACSRSPARKQGR
jgi:GntR family transcriptional regulator